MIRVNLNRSLTLDQLESVVWGPPTYSSHLVTTCHRLRTKPLKDFGPEDLRILLGQQISVDLLVPLALEKLALDPLVEGDFYPGDLLCNVLRLDAAFWLANPDARATVAKILSGIPVKPEAVQLAALAFDALP